MPKIRRGDFVRVAAASEFRPGQDGMAVTADDGESVSLVFGFDRHNRPPMDEKNATWLPEQWDLSELDLSSIES